MKHRQSNTFFGVRTLFPEKWPFYSYFVLPEQGYLYAEMPKCTFSLGIKVNYDQLVESAIINYWRLLRGDCSGERNSITPQVVTEA
jgi:hypothetical protein